MADQLSASQAQGSDLTTAWLHFLHTFALADHLGDASDAVRGFAKAAGLPEPDKYASLEEWGEWLETTHGVTEGIHALLLKAGRK